jgi:hypothetical protein
MTVPVARDGLTRRSRFRAECLRSSVDAARRRFALVVRGRILRSSGERALHRCLNRQMAGLAEWCYGALRRGARA